MIYKARASLAGAAPTTHLTEFEHPQNALRDDIREAELLLTAFRTMLLLALGLAPQVLPVQEAYTRSSILLMLVAATYNIAMGIACLFPARFGVRRPLILAMDTTLITAWLHYSGRFDLIPFYYVVVVVAAMWYRVLGGVCAAAVCNFLFLLLWARLAADPNLLNPPPFTSSMALNAGLLFVVGALAGYIAEAQEREREERLERDLLLANYQQEIAVSGELQPLLIAGLNAQSGRFDIGAAMQSARTVGGGDYLDVLSLPDGRTLLCMADVSGKSVRAQARIPLLKYSLRALAPLYPDPTILMTHLQSTLLPDLGPELYIAVVLVALDAENEELEWCNAGHIAPLLVRGSQILPLETTTPALGLFPEIEPRGEARDWKRGDGLLLHTDGLSDALSFGGTIDGEEQVHKLALKLYNPDVHATAAAQELVDLAEAVLEDKPFIARHFTLGEKMVAPRVHRDDVAVLIARFAPPVRQDG